jgi:hypothetical protein
MLTINQSLLHGDGSHKAPFWIHGLRNEERGRVKDILLLADENGINKLNIHGSGRYYEKRLDGWYLTSDSETCDKIHGLPNQGRKVN